MALDNIKQEILNINNKKEAKDRDILLNIFNIITCVNKCFQIFNSTKNIQMNWNWEIFYFFQKPILRGYIPLNFKTLFSSWNVLRYNICIILSSKNIKKEIKMVLGYQGNQGKHWKSGRNCVYAGQNISRKVNGTTLSFLSIFQWNGSVSWADFHKIVGNP